MGGSDRGSPAGLGARRVLEVGCGTGLLFTRLAPECHSYLGLDFSAPVLAQLQAYLDTRPDLAHVALRQRLATTWRFWRTTAWSW